MKWNILKDEVKTIDGLDLNFTTLISKIDFKKQYTSWKYLLVEGQSNSFLINSFSFFFFYIPIVILTYLLFKILNRLIAKCVQFKYFEQFRLNGYLIFMIMSGTTELFTYWFISDCVKLFDFSLNKRFFNVLTILLFCIFVFYIFSFSFLIKHIYKEKSWYFFSNYKSNLNGIIFNLFENDIIHFGLGVVHIVL